MNKENPHSSKLTKYLNQPEFRPVFYLVPLIAAAAVINVIYLSGIWLFVSTGILIISGALMVAISWVLAKANLNIKIKTLQMDSIISHLPSGVLAYDNDFNVLIFNPAAQEIFGLSQSEIFARKLSAEMASDPKFKLLAQVIFPSLAPTVVKRSEPGTYPQIVDISFSDPSLDLRVVTDRVADETGKITGFVKLITNRTREMELLKSKTEFITVPPIN